MYVGSFEVGERYVGDDADEDPSSVHGFSASYVALRNKAELSPVVEYFTLKSLLQEIIQLLCTFRRRNASEIGLKFASLLHV